MSTMRRRRARTVVVIAADADAGARVVAARGWHGQAVVVTCPEVLAEVPRLALGRRDRVAFVPGWHTGGRGRALARKVEQLAQVGGFGHARHLRGAQV